MDEALKRRIVRRETHSPRSVITIVTGVILIAALVWLSVEVAVLLLGGAPLLLSPVDAVAATLNLLAAPPAWAWGVGLGAAMMGLVLIGFAVLPGRRRRRMMTSQDLAVVVDDAVLAGMLERRAVAHCRTDRRQVRVAIARRVAHVRITPTSGSPIDIEDARAALDAVLLDAGVEPPLKLVVQVDKEGVLRP